MHFLMLFFCLSMLIRVSSASAMNVLPNDVKHHMDSVKISLLTCSAGDEVWSLYGHTAIRYQDLMTKEDLVINYGMFSFHQKFFILRFIFGKTDYQMGIEPFSEFITEYSSEGRGVVQQTLNLSSNEKFAITQALAKNYQPENRTYRYNFIYDNCTTRARDIILNNIDGKTSRFSIGRSEDPSYREMVHQWTQSHLWSQDGQDVLLGIKADRKNKLGARDFLPDSLRSDFNKTVVINKDGGKRMLITQTEMLLRPMKTVGYNGGVSPKDVHLILIVASFIILIFERKKKIHLWQIDATLLAVTGLAGIVLFAMVFSEHPTVSLNPQILALNPLNLIFIYPFIPAGRKGGRHWYKTALMIFLLLFYVIYYFYSVYAQISLGLAFFLMTRIIFDFRIKDKKADNE